LEAPLAASLVRSALDTLRARFPQTPVKAFVVTHHHGDHVSGVSTAFEAGLAAIAPMEIADFIRGLGVSAKQSPPPRRLTPVRDSMAIGTGDSRFVLYHVPSSHTSALLMAYFPEPKLLFEIDLALGPPSDRQALFDFIRGRQLDVAKLSRFHGPVMA